MVNRDVLAGKLGDLANRVARIRTHVPDSASALAANQDTLDLVAFNLMLAVQACADIAGHMISDEAWPAARNLAEGFARLEERGVLSSATAQSMRLAVGLHNVVAHGYAGVDVEACFRGATEGLSDLDAFAREVSTWVAAQPQGF